MKDETIIFKHSGAGTGFYVHVDHDQRIELCGLHQQDPAEAVNAAGLNTQRFQQQRNVTGAPHQQNPCVSSDERRGHTAQDTGHQQELSALQPVEGIEIGKGNADSQRYQHNGDRHLEAVEYGIVVVRLAEKLNEIVEGKGGLTGGKRLLEQRTDGVHEEQQERQQQRDGNSRPYLEFPALLVHSAPLLSSWTPRSRFTLPSSEKILIFSALTWRNTSVPLGIMESIEDSWIVSTSVPSCSVSL